MKVRIGRLKTITQYIFRDQIEIDTAKYPGIPEDATYEDIETWFNENMYEQSVTDLNSVVDQEEVYDNTQKEESYYLYVQPTLEDLRKVEEEK
jgi:hypothetical protein